ncbi:hypothetical protein QFZ64_003411 [Streptomyces sp. B3I8]|nr:hypothetical protein [Streptomyces sp. B3I8]
MALRKLGKDPESPSGGSPTIYLDEENGDRVARLAIQWCRALRITASSRQKRSSERVAALTLPSLILSALSGMPAVPRRGGAPSALRSCVLRARPTKAVVGARPIGLEVLTGVRPDRLTPTAMRPALHGQGAPGWMPELKADQWEGKDRG